MGVFFKMGGYKGLDLREALKPGECTAAGRHFSRNLQPRDLIIFKMMNNCSGFFYKKTGSRVEDSGKISLTLSNFPKKSGKVTKLFQKISTSLSNFSKIFR